MQYNQAHQIAVDIYKRLLPFCLLSDIAGDVKREMNKVNNIELCCVPRVTEIKNLFQEVTGVERSGNFVREVYRLGKLLNGDIRVGSEVEIMLPEQIKLKLVILNADVYFMQLLRRTSSTAYMSTVIEPALNAKGLCNTDDGIRFIEDCYSKQAGIYGEKSQQKEWVCGKQNFKPVQSFVCEYDLYSYIGVP